MSSGLPTPSDLPPSAAGTNPVFAQAMLRITDPSASRDFYEGALGMSFLTQLNFPDLRFSLFFYAYTDDEVPKETDPQSDRASWLWSRPYPTVELTWNWPKATLEESVEAADFGDKGGERYVTGNDEPKGFGYVGLVVSNLPAVVGRLKEIRGMRVLEGVTTEGGAATAVVADPDGYSVKLTERGYVPAEGTTFDMVKADPVFGSVMLRVKDPREALKFFSRLGFRCIARLDDDGKKCTEYFLAYSLAKPIEEAAGETEKAEWVNGRRECKVLLKHEWGTEEKDEQMYVNGNTKRYRGFGHVGIVVDDIYATVAAIETDGYQVVRKPGPFKDVGDIAFVAEPSTGYWVEVIKRTGEPADVPYEKLLGVGA